MKGSESHILRNRCVGSRSIALHCPAVSFPCKSYGGGGGCSGGCQGGEGGLGGAAGGGGGGGGTESNDTLQPLSSGNVW